MRGLSRLIDLRRSGVRPDGLVALWMPGTGARYAYEGTVIAEAKDCPTSTDMRAFVGLMALVIGAGGHGFSEAEAWARSLVRAGAKTVGLT